MYVINRTGVLAAVAAAIASTETNIDHVSIDEQDSDTAVLTFELRVRDRPPRAPGARYPPHARREPRDAYHRRLTPAVSTGVEA